MMKREDGRTSRKRLIIVLGAAGLAAVPAVAHFGVRLWWYGKVRWFNRQRTAGASAVPVPPEEDNGQ